jgi:hypothetical protein
MLSVFKSTNPTKLIQHELKETELQLMEAIKMREYYQAMETMLDNRLSRLIKANQSKGVDNV